MAIEDQAYENFQKGFQCVEKMPLTKRRSDLLEHVIEHAMRLRGATQVILQD